MPLRVPAALPAAAREVLAASRLSPATTPVDAIVLLGAAVRPDGTPSSSLRARIDGALAAWCARVAPVIVCTGAHHLHPPGEAVVSARALEAAGVPRAALMLDEKSRNTRGNLEMARGLLGVERRRVVLVTERFHLGRALALAAELGFEAGPWPVDSEVWRRPSGRARWLAREAVALALERAAARGAPR